MYEDLFLFVSIACYLTSFVKIKTLNTLIINSKKNLVCNNRTHQNYFKVSFQS
jgi:hypothetical protein